MGNNPLAKCDGNKGLSSSEFQPVLDGTLYIGVCPFYNGYIIGQYFFDPNNQITVDVFKVKSWKTRDMPSGDNGPKLPKQGLFAYY